MVVGMRLNTAPETYASKIFDTACAAGLIKANKIPSKLITQELYHKPVRKCKKLRFFQNRTFELSETLAFPTQTRLYRRVCLSWLCCLCNSRAELLEIWREIDELEIDYLAK